MALGLPDLTDLTLLWEAIDLAEDELGDALAETRAAHARVLTYLKDNGVFERPEPT